MINPSKFIKRPTSLPSFPPVNQGDDERYLWTLNRRAQTFTIRDLNGHTLVATITLTASKNFLTAFYRPKNRCVYCFGSDTVDIIDLDPASGTWATKKSSSSYPISPSGGFEGVYDGANDYFYIGRRWYNGALNKGGALNYTCAGGETFYQSRRLIMLTDTAVGQQFFVDVSSPYPEEHRVYGMLLLQTPNWASRLINNKWYSLQSASSVYRFNDFPVPVVEATISTTTNLFRGDTAYDPVNKKLFACGPLSTALNVIDVNAFSNLGNAPRSSLDTNEVGTTNLLYSKYSGFIYAKAGNISNLTGVSRVHYYNPALAVGSMWQGYMDTGEDSIATNPYSLHTMGLNSLKTYDK